MAILGRPIPTNATKQQLLAEIANLDGIIASQLSQIGALNAQITNLNATNATLSTANTTLQAANATLTEDNAALEAELASVLAASAADAEVVTSLQGFLDAMAGRGLIVTVE